MKKLILLILLSSFTQSMFAMSDAIKNVVDAKIEQVIGNDLLMIFTKHPTTQLIQENLRILQESKDILKRFSPTDAKVQPLQIAVDGLEARNRKLLDIMTRLQAQNRNSSI